jgi:hypothetical protein
MRSEILEKLRKENPDLEFESVDGNVIVKEKKQGRERSEKGGTYYLLNSAGLIVMVEDRYETDDAFRYAIGNYFKTEKEAKAYKQYLIDRQAVLDKRDNGEKLTAEDWQICLS